MCRKFIISDTHFGHGNIIKYCNRPYDNIFHMEKELIKNWNEVVGKNDIVYHLGDFSMKLNKGKTIGVINQLRGNIFLIQGNHDTHGHPFYKTYFTNYSRYPIIIPDGIILSHQPVFVNENMPYINIHGHLHNGGHKGEFNTSKHHFNASVECIDYRPILLDDILKKFK